MGKVIADVSISLDGFMAGPHISAENPMGEGGHRLHEWLFNSRSSEVDSAVAKDVSAGIGAVVIGRRTFDVGYDAWDQQTPYPVPTFVVTHRAKADLHTKTGTFTFITEGPASAVKMAQVAAGDRNVAVMGGGITQELLRSGLIDELHIHMIPVILNGGLRLFEHLGPDRIELEISSTVPSAQVTHVVYRRPGSAP
jgi:dihydrofolate reductase